MMMNTTRPLETISSSNYYSQKAGQRGVDRQVEKIHMI